MARPRKKPPTQPSNVPAIKARYDAAGTGRRWKGMQAPTTGPNTAITGQPKIRDRARDMGRNDWSGAKVPQQWATTLIGIGITPRFKRLSSARRAQITDLWADFVAQADADCVLNLYGLQTMVVRNWFESGEVFIRRRDRATDTPLTVPLQIQVIESDFVPMLDADTYPGLPAGNTIRQGIERNKYGRRIAYWVYRQHPGDRSGTASTIDASKLIRVPADEMLHVYEPKRPGQLRGVSELAATLGRILTVNGYDDNVMTRMQLANLFMAFVTQGLPTGPDDGTDPLTGQAYERDPLPLMGLEPGLVQELEPGQSVTFANPPEAGTTYSDYMRTQHMGTASGNGLPYELFSGDIRNISDRTLRIMINEFRRGAEARQWQIVIPQMCDPVVRWFAEALLLAGHIDPGEFDSVRRAEQAPHGWPFIHPTQDVQGKQMEVDAGFRSRSSVIGERGDDAEQVDEERKQDKEREDALGLTPPPPEPAGAPGGQQPNDQQAQAMLALVERIEARAPVINVAPAITVEAPRLNNRVIKRDPVTGRVLGIEHVDPQPIEG